LSRRTAALHGLLLACTVSLFAFNVQRHYFLGDDAFISFRYANHLAQGRGLVWNHEERVEGYTNFLWVVMMAGVLAMDGAPEVASNAVGIASGSLLLIGLAAFSLRAFGPTPLVWLAPLALAASRSFSGWCTGGLETLFFTLLVFAGLAAFLIERERGLRLPWASSTLLALAVLTRPDGAVFVLAVGAFFAGEVILRRRSLESALAWALPLALIVGTHLLWRHAYYGEWLPNTFYAKVHGAWWSQGFRYLGLFASDYQIGWFLPLAIAAPFLRRDATSALFAAATLLWLTYVAYVGGDRFEFRFLVPVLPYVYWLVAATLHQVAIGPSGMRGRLLAGAVALSLVATTAFAPRRPEATRLRHGVNTLASIAHYAEYRAREGRFLRRLSDEGVLPPDVVIAVGGAGAVPYYTDWTTVDRRGLNDAHIARLPLGERGIIGHEPDAPFDYLRQRGVVMFDALNRLVQKSDAEVRKRGHIVHDGHEMRLVAIPVRGVYLTFATPLDDDELAKIFVGLELP
jgi:hypothetical protein